VHDDVTGAAAGLDTRHVLRGTGADPRQPAEELLRRYRDGALSLRG